MAVIITTINQVGILH